MHSRFRLPTKLGEQAPASYASRARFVPHKVYPHPVRSVSLGYTNRPDYTRGGFPRASSHWKGRQVLNVRHSPQLGGRTWTARAALGVVRTVVPTHRRGIGNARDVLPLGVRRRRGRFEQPPVGVVGRRGTGRDGVDRHRHRLHEVPEPTLLRAALPPSPPTPRGPPPPSP